MKLILKLSIFTLLITCSIPVFAEIGFPSIPMSFWGVATLNGQPLTSGTTIKAYCGNNVIGETTLQENGIYGYNDPTKIKLLVGKCNETILFKYILPGETNSLTGENEMKYNGSFESGLSVNKNLIFQNTVLGNIQTINNEGKTGNILSSILPLVENNNQIENTQIQIIPNTLPILKQNISAVDRSENVEEKEITQKEKNEPQIVSRNTSSDLPGITSLEALPLKAMENNKFFSSNIFLVTVLVVGAIGSFVLGRTTGRKYRK